MRPPWVSVALYLLQAGSAAAHPDAIRLPEPPPEPVIGHVHVFADRNQTIALRVPGAEPVLAQLYRAATTTVVPVGQPIQISPSNDKPAAVKIDFPEHHQPTRYLLVFDRPGKRRLEITALPTTYLDRLRKVAREDPIVLIDPPAEAAAIFARLEIPHVVSERPPQRAQYVIQFQQKAAPPPHFEGVPRIVVAVDHLPSGREMWVSDARDKWRITLSGHLLNGDQLLTAEGQKKLVEVLLENP